MSSPADPRPRRVDVEGHVAEIADRGWTVIEDAIEPDFIEALAGELARLERELEVKPADNSFEGHKTLRVYNLLARGQVWWRVPVHPSVLPVVERVLDRGCLVSSLSSINIGPGEVAQPIHADDQLIPIPKPHPPTVCNTMWALTDFTELNGATRIISGTHLADRSPDYGQPYESEAAVMKKGSVLVWHGSLWHGGGANGTESRRVGIAMNYCAGYIRQQENQQLGIPPALVARMPKRLQELVGYGIYSALIGHIDKQSPASLLAGTGEPARGAEPDEAGRMVWDVIG
jgi:ectoine hydroxylase-related dioxygenase (phytanoyl-CoA dioxygenase family)